MLVTRFRVTVGQKPSREWGLTSSYGRQRHVSRMQLTSIEENGHTRHGKQNDQCKTCGRQSTAAARDRRVAPTQRRPIEQLLCARLSLRGGCRTVGVSLT